MTQPIHSSTPSHLAKSFMPLAFSVTVVSDSDSFGVLVIGILVICDWLSPIYTYTPSHLYPFTPIHLAKGFAPFAFTLKFISFTFLILCKLLIKWLYILLQQYLLQ